MDPEARPGGALTARPPPLATQTCPWTAVGARMTTLAPATTPSPTTSHLADYALYGRAAAARMITWFGTLSDGRGLYLQTRTPREAPLAGSGEWDHKQALYPLPRPAHTQPKPLPNRPWSRRRGGCRGAQTVPHERHTGHHGPSGGPSAAPHPPDALGQPAPTLRGFTAASAPSAPPSPRATRAPGRTPERRPII